MGRFCAGCEVTVCWCCCCNKYPINYYHSHIISSSINRTAHLFYFIHLNRKLWALQQPIQRWIVSEHMIYFVVKKCDFSNLISSHFFSIYYYSIFGVSKENSHPHSFLLYCSYLVLHSVRLETCLPILRLPSLFLIYCIFRTPSIWIDRCWNLSSKQSCRH